MAIEYKKIIQSGEFKSFVESFWMIRNSSLEDKQIVVLPDGCIILFFVKLPNHDFQIKIQGMETFAMTKILPPESIFYGISFKPLQVNEILKINAGKVKNRNIEMPRDYLNFTKDDLMNFSNFCTKADQTLKTVIPKNFDRKEIILFDTIFENNGNVKIKEIAKTLSWTERSIHRFFKNRYDLSMKQYCNIVRFKASFPFIKQGNLHPQGNFTDQSHFIKEIKCRVGETPKNLFRNENGKYIQLFILDNL